MQDSDRDTPTEKARQTKRQPRGEEINGGKGKDASRGAKAAQGRAPVRILVPDIEVAGTRREPSPIGVGISVPGSHEGGVALAQAAGHRLFEFSQIAGGDERWAKAREHKGAGDLFRALDLAQDVFLAVRTGLEFANAERPLSSWEKDQLQHAIKVAKKTGKRLRDMAPTFTELHEKAKKAAPLNDCARAWLEALALIEREHELRPNMTTKATVQAVTVSHPALAKRLRIADAGKRANVFETINLLWAVDHNIHHREIAYKLAALACGLRASALHTVHHACDFARKRHPLRPTSAKK